MGSEWRLGVQAKGSRWSECPYIGDSVISPLIYWQRSIGQFDEAFRRIINDVYDGSSSVTSRKDVCVERRAHIRAV